MKFTILIYYPHTKLTQKVNKQSERIPQACPCRNYRIVSITRLSLSTGVSKHCILATMP